MLEGCGSESGVQFSGTCCCRGSWCNGDVTSTWFFAATNSQPFARRLLLLCGRFCLDTGYFEGRLIALSRILYLPAPVIRLNRLSSQHFQKRFIEIHSTFALVKNQEEAL
jgi:hypothetical protein